MGTSPVHRIVTLRNQQLLRLVRDLEPELLVARAGSARVRDRLAAGRCSNPVRGVLRQPKLEVYP